VLDSTSSNALDGISAGPSVFVFGFTPCSGGRVRGGRERDGRGYAGDRVAARRCVPRTEQRRVEASLQGPLKIGSPDTNVTRITHSDGVWDALRRWWVRGSSACRCTRPPVPPEGTPTATAARQPGAEVEHAGRDAPQRHHDHHRRRTCPPTTSTRRWATATPTVTPITCPPVHTPAEPGHAPRAARTWPARSCTRWSAEADEHHDIGHQGVDGRFRRRHVQQLPRPAAGNCYRTT
jgi:hypothetical protein